MSSLNRTFVLSVGFLTFAVTTSLTAQDWPQWRGVNRDAKVTGFTAPESWPKELTRKWNVEVGEGDATPSLVGGRLYVFSRQDGNEVVRCLDAATGGEKWQDKYAAEGMSGPARSHSGPRSSPAVAEGKVVTLGVHGTLSCYDAGSGKRLWQNEDFKGATPRFGTSSSPLIVGGLCIAQVGEPSGGGIVAYDLETGKEKWKWTGDGPANGSPLLASVGDTKAVIAPTASNMVALDAASGRVLWKTSYDQGSRTYNAATPMVESGILICAGPNRGMTAQKLVKKGEELSVEKLWSNPDNSVKFNTPVVRDGFVFGLTARDDLFCINAKDGATAWSEPFSAATGGGQERERERGGGRRGRGGGRRGGGGGGFGSVVDAGPVLFALTPAGQLTAIEPTGEKLKRLATYKVADGGTVAYPVIAGRRIFIKDGDSVTLWAIE